jgi:hypothetical protein
VAVQPYISRYAGNDLTTIVLANIADAFLKAVVDGIAAICVPKLAIKESPPMPDKDFGASVLDAGNPAWSQ